jgi:hypothetical protein
VFGTPVIVLPVAAPVAPQSAELVNHVTTSIVVPVNLISVDEPAVGVLAKHVPLAPLRKPNIPVAVLATAETHVASE